MLLHLDSFPYPPSGVLEWWGGGGMGLGQHQHRQQVSLSKHLLILLHPSLVPTCSCAFGSLHV